MWLVWPLEYQSDFPLDKSVCIYLYVLEFVHFVLLHITSHNINSCFKFQKNRIGDNYNINVFIKINQIKNADISI